MKRPGHRVPVTGVVTASFDSFRDLTRNYLRYTNLGLDGQTSIIHIYDEHCVRGHHFDRLIFTCGYLDVGQNCLDLVRFCIRPNCQPEYISCCNNRLDRSLKMKTPPAFIEGRAVHKDLALSMLAAYLCLIEKRTEFIMSREFVSDEPFSNVAIEWQNDHDRDAFILRLIDKRKPRLKDGIEEAEYEIVTDPRIEVVVDPLMPPGTWKLLPPSPRED